MKSIFFLRYNAFRLFRLRWIIIRLSFFCRLIPDKRVTRETLIALLDHNPVSDKYVEEITYRHHKPLLCFLHIATTGD